MADSATDLLEPSAARPADQDQGQAASETAGTGPDEVLAADLLVEEISIDGMCGVY